jgi:Rieske Fe-S protein
MSPICRHLRCVVAWNAAERTWDCPCHGSRYTGEGRVIQGPSVKDLKEWNDLSPDSWGNLPVPPTPS